MSHHPITTPASPSLASPLFDASCDSIESLTITFTSPVLPTIETKTVTEAALGYHRNQQYSITAMTTSTGAVAERYAYTAYGQPTICNASGSVLTSSAIANRYTYTGREWDETLGLHHFRARWMSPLAGRFLGREPIGYFSTFGLYELEIALSALDPTGNSAMGTDDVDVMFTCLQSNYTQLSVGYANDKKRCSYVPLGILAAGRFAQLTNDLGVGVILISVQGILPKGLAGKITESVLAYILNQNTCNPSDAESDVKKKLVDLLTKYIKDKLKE